jgi:hypothetical protein
MYSSSAYPLQINAYVVEMPAIDGTCRIMIPPDIFYFSNRQQLQHSLGESDLSEWWVIKLCPLLMLLPFLSFSVLMILANPEKQ